MKPIPTFLIVLIFIVNFCAGFTIAFKLMTPYIEKENTQSFENNPDPNYAILGFTNNEVHTLTLSKLEEFKLQNPEYSFLVPNGKENYFAKKLNDRNKGMLFEIEVDQISDVRQLISVSSDDIRSVVKNTYEATDKKVFPKSSMWLNFRYTPLKILVSSIGGAIVCLIFFFIYKKYLAV